MREGSAHHMNGTTLKVSGAFAVAVLAGCAGETLLAGQWVNETKIVDAIPGDLTVVLREDGTATLHFDETKYVWFWTDFRYRTDGDDLLLLFPDADKDDEEWNRCPFDLKDDRILLRGDEGVIVFRRVTAP